MTDTFERGQVKFFDNRITKHFGFIELPTGEEIFFHHNDGAAVKIGPDGPVLCREMLVREPRKSDILLFERAKNRKGSKAFPWLFADDWDRAEKEIAVRPTYRFVCEQGRFRGSHKSFLWEGKYLPDLIARFGSLELSFQQRGDVWTRHWFEIKQIAGWVKIDFDPRLSPENQNRVIKPLMPLAYARQILSRANVCGVFGDAFGDGEYDWQIGNKAVAHGHYNRTESRVTIRETAEYDRTFFEGDAAQPLFELGQAGQVARNNSEACRFW